MNLSIPEDLSATTNFSRYTIKKKVVCYKLLRIGKCGTSKRQSSLLILKTKSKPFSNLKFKLKFMFGDL